MADAKASLVVRTYVPGDAEAVADLWRACDLVVPWNDPAEDLALKHAFQPDLLFVGLEDDRDESCDRILATVMAGYDGHRGWINYLAVDPEHRREGLGRQMMEVAERALRDLGCPKINLQVREGNTDVLAFYERIGFHLDPTVSLGKRLDGKSWKTKDTTS